MSAVNDLRHGGRSEYWFCSTTVDEHAASEYSWSSNINLQGHHPRQEYCGRPEYRFCTGESDIQAVGEDLRAVSEPRRRLVGHYDWQTRCSQYLT